MPQARPKTSIICDAQTPIRRQKLTQRDQQHHVWHSSPLSLLPSTGSAAAAPSAVYNDHHHIGDEEGNSDSSSCSRRNSRRRRRRRIPINLAACKFNAIQIAAERRGFSRCRDDDLASPLLVWSDLPVPVERVTELRPHQRVNHFPGMGEISRKDSLGRNMARAARLHPQEFDFVPPTWCLPQESAQFQQHLREAKKKSGQNQSKPVFISKPANGAMGHGIRIYTSGDQVPTSPEASSIVQMYLDEPFLVDGFKCDLRIYVLVTSCDPLRILFYNDGLLRLGTEKYCHPREGGSAERLYAHLTNYSINKRSGQYEKGSDDSTGSKRSIRFLNEYLQQRDHDVAQLWRSIIDLIIKTVLVAYPQVLLQYRLCRPGAPPGAGSVCFELLGFDIMLDSNLKPWLLEVNRSPSFGIDEPIDRQVKLGMLEEAFSLLGIRLSDQRRCQAAQKAEAQRRLLRGGGSSGNSSSGISSSSRHRREALQTRLRRLRREARQEDREARTCHRFRRIFPCDDRLRQERYARLLLDLFAAFMNGRAPALLKELRTRYDSAGPGPDEIVEMLAQLDCDDRGGSSAHQYQQQHAMDAECLEDEDDDESTASISEDDEDSTRSSVSGTSCWRQQRQQRLPIGRAATATARPTTAAGCLPSVSARSGRSQSLTPVPRRQQQQPRLKAVLDLSESSAASQTEQARELHRQLVDLSIRYPGKSAAEASAALQKLRQNWKFYRPKLAAYWLARLDAGKRRQIVDIVRQNATTALQRASASSLSPLLNRLLSRMLASNGQGLWNTFNSSAGGSSSGWEAGLTQSAAELTCCRRLVRLCQDCLLTVYLYSCHEMGEHAAHKHHMRLL